MAKVPCVNKNISFLFYLIFQWVTLQSLISELTLNTLLIQLLNRLCIFFTYSIFSFQFQSPFLHINLHAQKYQCLHFSQFISLLYIHSELMFILLYFMNMRDISFVNKFSAYLVVIFFLLTPFTGHSAVRNALSGLALYFVLEWQTNLNCQLNNKKR